MSGLLFDEKTANISDNGLYRYDLTRQWAPGDNKMVFIMLNPSTADADVDDPTIRRCVGFAKRFGCSGLRVVNLFGLRATDPKALALSTDPIGGGNIAAIRAAVDSPHTSPIVVAWGSTMAGDKLHAYMVHQVRAIARLGCKNPHCLGTTKDGHPRHPLYVKGDTPLEVWP